MSRSFTEHCWARNGKKVALGLTGSWARFLLKIYLFVYLWLCQVLVAARQVFVAACGIVVVVW